MDDWLQLFWISKLTDIYGGQISIKWETLELSVSRGCSTCPRLPVLSIPLIGIMFINIADVHGIE